MTSTPAEGRLRVVLADDHPPVLEEIRALLSEDFDVIAAVRGARTLIASAEALRPDAVISDISMPDMDGIEAARRILAAGTAATAIVLTMHNDPHLLDRAIGAGVRGFVLKVDAGEELIDAVREAERGGTYVSRSVRAR